MFFIFLLYAGLTANMKGCNGMTGRILSQIFDFLKLVKPTDGEKFLIAIGGFIGGVFSFAVGGVDDAMIWLIILVVIDYISGSAASFREHNWCSEHGFCELFKKLFIFLTCEIRLSELIPSKEGIRVALMEWACF